MVKCDELTVPQLKKMCQIKANTYPFEHRSPQEGKQYEKASKLTRDALLPKCCGKPNEWVNPYYSRQLPNLHRRLDRPKGTITGKQFVAWLRDNLEHDGLVRTSSSAGGGMTGWTDAWGSTGYSISKEKGDVDVHIVLSAEEVGVAYVDDIPVRQGKVHPPIQKTFERLGLKVKDIQSTGYGEVDHDLDFNIHIQRPHYLSDR